MLRADRVATSPSHRRRMSLTPELAAAFDGALRTVEGAIARQMRTRSGESARAPLERLRAEIVTERQAAMGERGVDREWVGRLVREVAAWAPDTDMELIAALGRIARLAGRAPA
jgi:hypothetical protein